MVSVASRVMAVPGVTRPSRPIRHESSPAATIRMDTSGRRSGDATEVKKLSPSGEKSASVQPGSGSTADRLTGPSRVSKRHTA